jgi:Sulfotransferase domain
VSSVCCVGSVELNAGSFTNPVDRWPTGKRKLMPMTAFKRRPPAFAVRVAYCFVLDFVIAPVVRRLERSDRILRVLGAATQRRARSSVARNPFGCYTPGEQDVFVMAYPKSGQNWMLQIVYQLIHHGKGEFDHIHSVVPWPDVVLATRTWRNYAIPLRLATAWRTAPEPKRVIKTHLDWELLPYSKEARYIAVIRDPKDVFVSFYFFARNNLLGRAMPSLSAIYRSYLKGESLMGSWALNAAGYWAQRHRPNVLVVSFASMKRDLEATVRRLAEFLEIRVSDEVIQEVCRKSSFDYMKSIDERFAPFQGAPWRSKTFMMRNGEQGASSALLTPEQQREIDAIFIAELQKLGSDLPYDKICGYTTAE